MNNQILFAIAGILFFGIGAHWLAWRLKFPVIIFLLTFGFLIGPVTGLLNPSAVFGNLLFPLVTILVAVILFEGGLSLRLDELKQTGKAVWNLLTIGFFVTWLLITASAYWFLDLNLSYAMLLGAILVVTGPTVVGPLLHHIRPTDKSASILKWEGIIIDPIGALFTLLVYDILFIEGLNNTWPVIVWGIFKTIIIALVVGGLGTWALIQIIKRFWAPDQLHAVMTLTLVIAGFVISNYFQHESGLFTVTVMGIILANQRHISIRHIEELKENLRILFIASLFIILGARLKLESLNYINPQSLLFLGSLILLVRPVAVFISTIRSGLTWQEKSFMAWMAPRGIVAAAVASIFSFRLAERGYEGAAALEAYTFLVIIGTVVIYGVSSGWIAQRLNVAKPPAQGVLIIGAHVWARALAKALKEAGVEVLLCDTNYRNVQDAQKEGLQAQYGDILLDYFRNHLNLDSIGYLLAVTPNNEANSLIAVHFMKDFGRERVYQVCLDAVPNTETGQQAFRGRFLFNRYLTYDQLGRKVANGAKVKNIQLAADFDSKLLSGSPDSKMFALFLINENKDVQVFTPDVIPSLKAGQTLVALVEGEK